MAGRRKSQASSKGGDVRRAVALTAKHSLDESESKSLVVIGTGSSLPAKGIPNYLVAAGGAGEFAWDEFFHGKIRNKHTRTAYMRSVRRFFEWVEPHEPEMARIKPGLVGEYFDQLRGISLPSKKLHLAAIRAFFDVLVQRHVLLLNPAHSVRTERYSVTEGRTPAITVGQAKTLLDSIKLNSVLDFRDRAMIAVLIYTAARAGAVGQLALKDLAEDGTQFVLRFSEKGGKARSIPVRHDLQRYLQEYLRAAELEAGPKDSPLFRTGRVVRSIGEVREGRTGQADGPTPTKMTAVNDDAMSGVDIWRMVKRRLKAAGLPGGISPHSFRGCVATDLLSHGVALEDVQHLLGHADARTTRLYDRRQKQVTRNIVERISV
jgi:integrase/recombinase XerD